MCNRQKEVLINQLNETINTLEFKSSYLAIIPIVKIKYESLYYKLGRRKKKKKEKKKIDMEGAYFYN